MDREKVIKGLKICSDVFLRCEQGCPYFNEIDPPYCNELKKDALALLLKEQEPVEPEVEVLNEVDRLYRCPKCHKHFFYRKQKYCDQCGQAVKWDD